MREILVTKDLAYAAKVGGGTIAGFSELDVLSPGAIGIFTETGGLVTVTSEQTILESIGTSKYIYIGVGGAQGPKISQLIPTSKSLVRTSLKAYVAGTAQVIQVDDLSANSASLSVNDTEAIVRIKNLGAGTFPPAPAQQVSVRKTAAMTTYENVVDALIAAYNAKYLAADRFATLSKSGSSHAAILVITAPVNQVLSVSVDGILAGVSVAQTVGATFSQGASAQVLELEKNFSTEKGNTNQTYQSDLWWKYAFVTDPAVNYVCRVLEWQLVHSNPLFSQNSNHHYLVLATPTGASGTGVAAIADLMVALYSNEGLELAFTAEQPE